MIAWCIFQFGPTWPDDPHWMPFEGSANIVSLLGTWFHCRGSHHTHVLPGWPNIVYMGDSRFVWTCKGLLTVWIVANYLPGCIVLILAPPSSNYWPHGMKTRPTWCKMETSIAWSQLEKALGKAVRLRLAFGTALWWYTCTIWWNFFPCLGSNSIWHCMQTIVILGLPLLRLMNSVKYTKLYASCFKYWFPLTWPWTRKNQWPSWKWGAPPVPRFVANMCNAISMENAWKS